MKKKKLSLAILNTGEKEIFLVSIEYASTDSISLAVSADEHAAALLIVD